MSCFKFYKEEETKKQVAHRITKLEDEKKESNL
jgi:hypothetical protein